MNHEPQQPLLDKRLGVILVIALLAAVVPFFFANGKSKVAWETSFDAASTKARQLNRPMLVYFTATWCGPCQNMKQHVFPDASVEKVLNNQYVPVMIETTREDDEVQSLGQRFAVQYLPTMIITDADGNVITQRTGGIGAADLVAWLKPHAQSDDS